MNTSNLIRLTPSCVRKHYYLLLFGFLAIYFLTFVGTNASRRRIHCTQDLRRADLGSYVSPVLEDVKYPL